MILLLSLQVEEEEDVQPLYTYAVLAFKVLVPTTKLLPKMETLKPKFELVDPRSETEGEALLVTVP